MTFQTFLIFVAEAFLRAIIGWLSVKLLDHIMSKIKK